MRIKNSSLNVLCVILGAFWVLACTRVEKIEQKDLEKAIADRAKIHEMKTHRGVVNLHNLSFRKKLDADIHRNTDWWTSLEIGEEVLILSSVVKDSAGIEYLEIQRTNLSKDTGYARAAFIAVDGRLVVVSAREAFRYSSASLTRLTKDTVPFMALIGVYPQTLDGDLIQFDYNDENGIVFQKQYIEERQVSYMDSDIDAAKFFFLAKSNPDSVLKMRFLQKAEEFKSQLFGSYISDYLAILKGSLPPSVAKDSVKKISPAKKIKVAHSVTYYSQPTSDSLALGMSSVDDVLVLLYETNERMTINGKTATWFFVEKKGWIFGSELFDAMQDESKKPEKKDRKKKNKDL